MADSTFWLLVVAIPIVLIGGLLLLARTDSYFSRHPGIDWMIQGVLASGFILMALGDLFSKGSHRMIAVIHGSIGVLLGARAYQRSRAQKKGSTS